jgi:hypothetical protein
MGDHRYKCEDDNKEDLGRIVHWDVELGEGNSGGIL